MHQSKLAQYASDLAAFQADVLIPGARGVRRFGEVMADFQRERFAALNPALRAVALGEKPPIGRFWWEATKGASKDSDLALCLLWLLAFSPRALSCQVGAADRDQADELRKAAANTLRCNPLLARRVSITNWQIRCEETGATADIIAADVAGSHGARPDVLIVNEASHIGKEDFAANLMDNAAKVPQGLAVVATNAGFLDTWQWRWRELARESDRWSFHRWAQPAPWLDPAEIAEAERRNTSSRFRRLFLGDWLSGTGDALSSDDIEAAIKANLQPMTGTEQDFAFVGGLDLGTRNDRSALVVVGCHLPTQRLRLAVCQAWAPGPGGTIDLEAVEHAALQTNHYYGLAALCFDPYQAMLMGQRLTRVGVPMVEVTATGRNLDAMAAALLQAFRGRTIDLYPEPELVRDLGRLSIVERSWGYKLEAPRDASGHADRAMALALCLPWATDAMSQPEPYEAVEYMDLGDNDYGAWANELDRMMSRHANR